MFILRKKSTRSCLMLYFKFLDLLLSSQNTDSSTVTSGSLGLLTFNTETPPMTDTSVKTDFLHAIVIFTKFVVQVIGNELRIFTIAEITLSVQKPNWNFEVFLVGAWWFGCVPILLHSIVRLFWIGQFQLFSKPNR